MYRTLSNNRNRTGQVADRAHGSLRAAFAGLAVALLLGGCAVMNQGDQVFLQQHRASVALAQAVIAAEFENPDVADMLYESESALNEACGALQSVAYRKSNRETVYPWHQMSAYGSLEACTAQIRAVEDLLWRVDPETAGHYLDRALVSAQVDE